jgi:hypothetical protein
MITALLLEWLRPLLEERLKLLLEGSQPRYFTHGVPHNLVSQPGVTGSLWNNVSSAAHIGSPNRTLELFVQVRVSVCGRICC